MNPQPTSTVDLCESATTQISDAVLKPPVKWGWLGGFAIAFSGLMLLNACIGWLLYMGVGIWGVRMPVAWGFAIVNFVWWIGIGHAGTFISAILLLLHQQWRTAINRFSEAMTLFAVACAGLFPLMHLGRPWVFYWLLPYPDTMRLWPQWRSPLVWDVFAVSTYFTVSLIYWYIGLVPDLANMRDRAKHKLVKIIYGIFALGWRGSAFHWARYEMIYLLLAGLATPLVLSVHSVVSFDFSVGIVPGWHSTIFPPYFVAGAIFSGFAMVLTLVIPVRAAYGMKNLITDRHLDNAAKVMLTTGLMVTLGYLSEHFMAWYSDEPFEEFMTLNRMFGPYWPVYWTVIACNVLIPQVLWFRAVRYSPIALWIVALLVNVGMWAERYLIVVVSLHRDFLPSSWGQFHGTRWDWMTYLGTLGLFFTLLFLFIRFVPMIAMAETRKDLAEEGGGP
jgi:molybdopterin-containing oxidoreductase family membrane subunit